MNPLHLLTTEELAAKWRVSTSRIRQLAAAGRIQGAYKLGRNWHFDAKAEVLPTDHQRKKGNR